MTRAAPAPAVDPASNDELDPGLNASFVGPQTRLLWNLLSARMARALAPYGVHLGALSTLALLSANPGCSQTRLARELGIDKSAFVAILDQLESKGLASRVRMPNDRRRHALWITPEGEALLQKMHASSLEAGRPIREELSPEEFAQLQTLLDRAYRALVRDEEKGAAAPAEEA